MGQRAGGGARVAGHGVGLAGARPVALAEAEDVRQVARGVTVLVDREDVADVGAVVERRDRARSGSGVEDEDGLPGVLALEGVDVGDVGVGPGGR